MPKKKTAVLPPSTEVAAIKKAQPDIGIDRYELSARSMEITGPDDFRAAGELVLRLASGREGMEAYWAPMVTKAKAVYDEARGMRDEILKRIDTLREVYERKMSDYQIAERKKGEESSAIFARGVEEMRTKLRHRADELIMDGKFDEARSLRMRSDLLQAAPPLPDEDERVEGLSGVDDFEVEITDLMALVKGVADGKVPLNGVVMKKPVELFTVRESMVKSIRASMGEAFDWPGVKITPKISYRARTNQ